MKINKILRRHAVSAALVTLVFAIATEAAPVRYESVHANATGQIRASIGQTVSVSGASSTNAAGGPLTYRWTLHAPAGSAAHLSNPNSIKPHFTVDLLGDYVAELVVSDGVNESVASSVRISTDNATPIARAGTNQHINVGQPIALDANASTDADGDVLTAHWRVVDAPAQSLATAVRQTNLRSNFTADLPGDYTLELTVSDDHGATSTSTLMLSTANARPNADAGPNRRAIPGQTLYLDALGSTDPEHADLSHQWSLLHAPAQSEAMLRNRESSQSTFTADEPGLYVVQLGVSDGTHANVLDTAEILVEAMTGGSTTDTDGDGVIDTIDNCVELANPSQLDTNGDGFGNRCDADIDDDGFVTNFGDLGLLRIAFFSTPGAPNWNPDADFNGDSIVNTIDLGIMRSFFFQAPGPIAITFINPDGGSWHDPANWSPAVVPDVRYTVRIDLDADAVVEYSTGTSEVRGIRTTSPLIISGGALSVNGNAQFNDTLTLQNSGSLANANVLAPESAGAPLINVPSFTTGNMNNVTLAADVSVTFGGTLSVIDRLTFEGGSILLESSAAGFANLSMGSTADDSVLDGTGDIRLGGTASNNRILVNGTAERLIIGEGVTIRADTQGGEMVVGRAVLLNGTVNNAIDGINVTLCASPLTSTGTWSAQNNAKISTAGFNFCTALFTESAILTAASAEIELRGGITNEGSIDITNGTLSVGEVSFASDIWLNTGSVVLNEGLFELSGNYAAGDIGTITGSGELVLAGQLDGEGQSLDVASLFEDIVTLGNGGSILSATLTGTPLTIPDSTTFTFDNVTLATDLALFNLSSLNVRNDLMMDDAVISINNTSSGLIRSVGPSGSDFTFGGTGEILFNSTNPTGTNSVIDSVGPNNIFDTGITVRSANSGGTIGNVSRGLTFRGTIINDTPGTRIDVVGNALIIEGTVDASNDGDIRFTISGGLGLIAGTANLSVDAAEMDLFGDLTIEGMITATNDAILDIGNNLVHDWANNGTINITNSTLEVGGTVTTSGLGTITGNGSTLVNGFIDNTGDGLDVGARFPGDVAFTFGSTINGGSIINTPITLSSAFERLVLTDVTLATLIDVNDSVLFANTGLVMDNGTIALNSNSNSAITQLNLGDNETMMVSGQGEILLGGTATLNTNNRVNTGGNVDLVIGPNIVMRTAGAGGALISATTNTSSLNWQGTMISNVPGRQIGITADSMTIEGNLQVGAGAIIDLPAYTLTGSASVDIDVAGPTSSEFGRLTGDAATLNGTLNIALTGGFAPMAGDSFNVITYNSLTGTFGTENLPALGGGLSFSSDYAPAALTLNVN